tara:strand:+ start:6460 stop:7332 length:873 start_codon:yes stop_codon:yes gene_type:complete
MPLRFFPFKSTGDTLLSRELLLLNSQTSFDLNRGFSRNDFENKIGATGDGASDKKGVIQASHIFKPEFYGSPSPHVLGVSSDTYYRSRSNNKLNRYYRHEGIGSIQGTDISDIDRFADVNAWQPIEGLSTTVYVPPGETPRTAFVCASFHAHEKGGKVGDPRSQILREGRATGEGNKMESLSGFYRSERAGTFVAFFAIFLDRMDGNGPRYVNGTERRIFGTGGGRYRCRRMNHSIIANLITFTGYDFSLTEGENKISVRCLYRLPAPDTKGTRHVYVDARNLVVDVIYK